MHRIYYAGDRFLTGSEIARALVDYAAALAQHGRAATIEIPVHHEDDVGRGVVNFLVGPASQIVTEEIEAVGYDEIEDDQVVAHLRTLTAELAPMHPVTSRPTPDRVDSLGYDWTDEV